MGNVNDYVGIMRQTVASKGTINPNSETNVLKQELITHYKNNLHKAWSLINGIETGNNNSISAEQRLHYDAAVIAARGYSTPASNIKSGVDISNTKQKELNKLKAQGWKPLITEQMLLVEG